MLTCASWFIRLEVATSGTLAADLVPDVGRSTGRLCTWRAFGGWAYGQYESHYSANVLAERHWCYDELSDNLYVRFAHEDPRDAISSIEEHWKSYSNAGPLTYTFVDEQFDALYRSEERMGQVFGAFTILAIFIACLGLLGLSAYTAEQRTREIGIRKVLGASVPSLLILLNKDFIKLIGIAFVLAVPVSWYFMQEWLRSFAYSIEMNGSVIFITILATLAVVTVTVSWQSIKAATMKPVDTLQTE